MRQNWEDLLFLHWPVLVEVLRPLIPRPLEIDTFEGKAWVSITPFNLTGLRVVPLPSIPWLGSFYELNVRTYVHLNGVPGIWFFSLDASKLIHTVAARMLFMLPYFKASISFAESPESFQFTSKRLVQPAAHFRATWSKGVRLRDPDQESLAFFLVERYAFYVVKENKIWLTKVYHHPWILDEATVLSYESSMFTAAGIPEPTSPPIAHFSRFLNVEIWPPAQVRHV